MKRPSVAVISWIWAESTLCGTAKTASAELVRNIPACASQIALFVVSILQNAIVRSLSENSSCRRRTL